MQSQLCLEFWAASDLGNQTTKKRWSNVELDGKLKYRFSFQLKSKEARRPLHEYFSSDGLTPT